MPSRPEELTSWKDIASYLKITVRTAQLWEQERGLPVRRLPGPRGRVYASVEELERWKAQSPQAPAPESAEASGPRTSRRRLLAISAVCLCGIAGLGLGLARLRHGPPAQFRIERGSFIAMDSAGRDLWRKPLETGVDPDTPADRARFVDVNGDGDVEVLFAPWYKPQAVERRYLICYAHNGAERWRFAPGRRVRTASERFDPPFFVSGFVLGRFGAKHGQRIVVASDHHLYYPSQIALLSADGRLLREYWHSGQLQWPVVIDVNGDGDDDVVLVGIRNASKQATVVALDPRVMEGASVEDNPDYQLQGFSPGKELRRVLLPQSCLGIKSQSIPRMLSVQRTEDAIVIAVEQAQRAYPDTASLFFHLNHDLSLRSIGMGSDFTATHERMYRRGELDHRFSDAELDALRRAVK